MQKWLKRIRGAVVMGALWAVVWAPLGVLLGMIVDRDGAMDEPWILVGALPGFIGGVVFSVVLAIAARRRRFHELSMPRFAGWGALAGVLVGALPLVLGTLNPRLPAWLPFVFIAVMALLSAGSAAGSLALARLGEKRSPSDLEPAEPELAGGRRGGNVRP
jgi:hypothetical protein